MLCRRAVMPACESLKGSAPDQRPPLNTAPLFIRLGDVVDFGINWSAWASANSAKIKTSVWAAAGMPVPSPHAPAIVDGSELIDAANQATTFVLDAGGEAVAVGDEYFIENTVVFEKTADAPVAYPDRTVTRRLNIKVVS